MFESGDWIEPRVVTTGCCEGWRWHLQVAAPDTDRSHSRLAGLAVNPAAPADVLLAVARDGGRLPRLVLAERLYQDSSFADELPDVAAALVAVATQTHDPHLLTRLVFGGDFPAEAIAAFAASPDYRVRASVPYMDACPAQMLATLAEDPHPDVRQSVAGRPDLDLGLLIKLARDPDVAVRDTVGDRTQELPAEIIEILARDPISTIRAYVIERADASLAEELAADPDPLARAAAARSGRLCTETMVTLARDPEPNVRRALTWPDHASGTVLAILAADSEPEVRRLAALHRATPNDAMAVLAADPNDAVAKTAVATIAGLGVACDLPRPLPSLERLEASVDRLSVEQLRDLIGSVFSSPCPPAPRPWPVEEAEETRRALLAQCAESRYARLRAVAATDWRLPEEVGARLADDRDPMVRRWLAKSSRDPGILRRLAASPIKGIADALAGNPGTPPEVLERLPAKPHRLARHWKAPGPLLARLLDGADHVTRLAIATHPNTPPEVLARLAQGDSERDVIRGACSNPALPVSVMRELLVPVDGPTGAGRGGATRSAATSRPTTSQAA